MGWKRQTEKEKHRGSADMERDWMKGKRTAHAAGVFLRRGKAMLLALLMLLQAAGIAAVAMAEEDTEGYGTLLADMLEAYEAQQRMEADLQAMDSEVARAVAAHWRKVYLDPDYQLLLYGKDDPAQLPISGRHAFVVLGYELKDGKMTPELKGRCDAAAAAAMAFPESVLVCSGGATGSNNPDKHTEAGLMRDYLMSLGIDGSRIFADERALTTAQNAVNTFEILREEQVGTITIVTSGYHQRWGQVLYNAVAAQYREKFGFPVEIIGNFCYDIAPESKAYLDDARIAIRQLGTILNLSEKEMKKLRNKTQKQKR